MTIQQLYLRISSMSPSLRKEVEDFIDFLISKPQHKSKLKERKFGCVKGKIIMLPGFDDPLEDFKEYMQ